MGTYADLGKLRLAGKLRPYNGPMPKTNGVRDSAGMSHHYPLHIAAENEEYWRTKRKGCLRCEHSARAHERLGCTEAECLCTGLRMRRRKPRGRKRVDKADKKTEN